MEWIKLWTAKWLYGSGRTMTPEKRGIWADLLALAAETKFRDGTLRFDTNQPMDKTYICAILRLTSEEFDSALVAFKSDINTEDGNPRVKVWEDGTIELTNFTHYQEVPENKKKLSGRELELYQRSQLNKLAEQYPIEAANTPAVRKIIEGANNDKSTT